MSSEHRINFLEQKLTVMQKEISEVLGEMQQALTAMMRSQAIAASVADVRLKDLEAKVFPQEEETEIEHSGGKEI